MLKHDQLSAGKCLADQAPCSLEHDCYPVPYHCDGFWDCPLRGTDELYCRKFSAVFISLCNIMSLVVVFCLLRGRCDST